VQVDPIKPKFKLPGTKRLKLKCDEPLSKIAFTFKLRRYTMTYALSWDSIPVTAAAQAGAGRILRAASFIPFQTLVNWQWQCALCGPYCSAGSSFLMARMPLL
jgi:hypothetical protein